LKLIFIRDKSSVAVYEMQFREFGRISLIPARNIIFALKHYDLALLEKNIIA